MSEEYFPKLRRRSLEDLQIKRLQPNTQTMWTCQGLMPRL